MMNKYQNGKIYKIINSDNNNVYFGSTIETLKRRFHNHLHNKTASFDKLNSKYENCKIILVENYPCNSKNELLQREKYYILNNECVNISIPLRTSNEWKNDNKEYLSQYGKQYRINNIEKCKLLNKKNYEKKKDTIEYKNQQKEYKKKYRIENADKLKEKINCICGSVVNKTHIGRHEKSLKHINFIKTNQ